MMSRFALGLAVAASAVLALSVARAADDPGKDKEKKIEVKCPVSGKPIDKEHHVAYKGAEVYFCCPNCPKAFEKDTAKFATKANLQLVQTEQAVEKKCPLTGRPLNKEQVVAIEGVDVQFCCMNCKGKVAKMDKKEQVETVFADKAFDKAYEVKKEEKK
jgi:YHS domain-containing protein